MKAATFKAYQERMLRVLVHVQEHLDEELSLDALARVATFSPYHFHRIFRGMVGEPLKEHIRRLRLERAAQRLKVGEAAVAVIASEAGYETHEAFTRAFRSTFDVPPAEFRAAARRARLASPSGVHYDTVNFRPVTAEGEPMEVKIEELPERRVAFVRHVGPYSECSAAWDRLTMWLGKEGHLGAGTMFLGLCHDDPEVTAPKKLRYDACVTVDDTFVPEEDIGAQSIAGGTYGTTTHFGPFETIGDTYATLMGQWLPRSGYEVRAAPCLEVYHNDPETTEPEDLITDILVPLRGREEA